MKRPQSLRQVRNVSTKVGHKSYESSKRISITRFSHGCEDLYMVIGGQDRPFCHFLTQHLNPSLSKTILNEAMENEGWDETELTEISRKHSLIPASRRRRNTLSTAWI